MSGRFCRQRPVDAAVATLLSLFIDASGPASDRLYELVSSRSCVRLSSYLHAWTLFDILGLLLCFQGLAYGVDYRITKHYATGDY